MTEYYLVYDMTTGNIRFQGSCPVGQASRQPAPDGCAVAIVPMETFGANGIQYDVIRDALASKVDAQAGEICSLFITVAPGQEMRYLRKEQQARNWTPGTSNADDPQFCMLKSEAVAMGQTVDAFAAFVITKANQWLVMASKIEALRNGTKKRIANAPDNIKDILAASGVDWSEING